LCPLGTNIFHFSRHQAPGVSFKSPVGVNHGSQANAGINLNSCFFAFVGNYAGGGNVHNFGGSGFATYS